MISKGASRPAELLGDDGRLERIGRLLRAAVLPRHVPVEVAALDGGAAERRGAFVGADLRAGHGGNAVEVGAGRGVLGGPVAGEEGADLLAEPLVFGTVAEIHGLLLGGFAVEEKTLTKAAEQITSALDGGAGRRISQGAMCRVVTGVELPLAGSWS